VHVSYFYVHYAAENIIYELKLLFFLQYDDDLANCKGLLNGIRFVVCMFLSENRRSF